MDLKTFKKSTLVIDELILLIILWLVALMFRMFILFCFMLLSASVCYAEPIGRYLQGMVGTLNGDKVWQVDDSTTGEPLVADLGDLLYGGGAIQSNFSDTAIEYGYESGGLVSFKNNTSYFVAVGDNGGTVLAELDNEFWQLDIHMGAYAGLRIGEHIRLYGTAGPAVLIGSLSIEDDEESASSQAIIISSKNRQTKAALGFYGKLGLELMFGDGITVGASVRQVNAKLDFGDAGEMTFDHPQYFITVGKMY